MSLFKILKGASERLASQAFHDGYAYFTPDDGGFYIDALVGEEEKRVRINPKNGTPSASMILDLKTNAWQTDRQTVSVSGLGQIQNGVIGLPQTATPEQRKAVCSARMRLENQKSGAVDIVCDGNVPTIDVPAEVILLYGDGSGSKTAYVTLLSDKWEGKNQVVMVGGITADSNGMIGTSVALTQEQEDAIAKAGLTITAQGVESITVTYTGKKPTIDLPISIVVFD